MEMSSRREDEGRKMQVRGSSCELRCSSLGNLKKVLAPFRGCLEVG
jgi:hypothetical protein